MPTTRPTVEPVYCPQHGLDTRADYQEFCVGNADYILICSGFCPLCAHYVWVRHQFHTGADHLAGPRSEIARRLEVQMREHIADGWRAYDAEMERHIEQSIRQRDAQRIVN